jgi:hypothetical protein
MVGSELQKAPHRLVPLEMRAAVVERLHLDSAVEILTEAIRAGAPDEG